MSDDAPIESSAAPADTPTDTPAGAPPARSKRKQRTSPRTFLREVRSELRKVAWPGRKELISYSLVVLVSVTLITLYITALDQVFGAFILRVFGS